MNIKNWIKIIRMFFFWLKKKMGWKTIDYKRGVGYYLQFNRTLGQQWTPEMHSGKKAIFKLLDYKNFRDPPDMTEYSFWTLEGYYGEPEIKRLTFRQFVYYYKDRI